MSFSYESYTGESSGFTPKKQYSSGDEREDAILAELETAMSGVVSAMKGYVSVTCSGHLADDYDDMPGDNINMQITTLLRPSDPTPDTGLAAAAGSAQSYPPEASTAAPMTEDLSPPAAQAPLPQAAVPATDVVTGDTGPTSQPEFVQPAVSQPLDGVTQSPADVTYPNPNVSATEGVTFTTPQDVPPAGEDPSEVVLDAPSDVRQDSEPELVYYSPESSPEQPLSGDAEPAPSTEPSPADSVAAPPPAAPPAQEQPMVQAPTTEPEVVVDPASAPMAPQDVPDLAANSPVTGTPDPMPEAPIEPPPAQ